MHRGHSSGCFSSDPIRSEAWYPQHRAHLTPPTFRTPTEAPASVKPKAFASAPATLTATVDEASFPSTSFLSSTMTNSETMKNVFISSTRSLSAKRLVSSATNTRASASRLAPTILSPRAASMALFVSERKPSASFQNLDSSSSTPEIHSFGVSGQPCRNTDRAREAFIASGIARCASSAVCGVMGAMAARYRESTSAMTVCAARLVVLVGASTYSLSLLTSKNTLDRNATKVCVAVTADAYA